LRAAASFLVAVLLCLAPTGATQASDWVEDQTTQTNSVPRPAPPISRLQRPAADGQAGSPAQSGPAGARATFSVKPSSGGSRPTLEGNVSKWGRGPVNPDDYALNGSAADSNLQGSASEDAVPGQRGRLNGQVAAMFQTPPIVEAGRPARVPPEVFRGWIEKSHPSFALSASTMDPLSVLEIKGAWDDADHTLRSLGIRHTTVRAGKLRDMPLEGVRVIVVNCAGNVPREALQRIRDFVARGGFLLTTDWALDNLLSQAFPGYVEWNGGKTDGNVVDAQVVDPDPVLFHRTVTNATWKVDEGSQTLRVVKMSAVRVLARSQQLRRDDPDGQGILAVTFRFGRGQVLHLVGHFDNNSTLAFLNSLPDPAPIIGISLRQALAANFVVAALSQGSGQSAQQPAGSPTAR